MLTIGQNLGQLDNGGYAEECYTEINALFRALDTLVQAHAKSASLTIPPANPTEGDTYIVPANATGVWAGHTNQITRWTARSAGGTPHWEFYTPKINWTIGVDDAGTTGRIYRFTGTAWVAEGVGPGLPTSLMSGLTPVAPNATDNAVYEMGVKVRFAQSGVINAIRYYKAASETGAHTGHIWSATGQLLATVVFSNETASGWQEQALAQPLVVQANTTYVVSVNVNTHYAMTVAGLNATITNGDISSVADGSNGVFNTVAGSFPATSFNNSNYFRDVVFTGDTATVSTVVGYASGQGGTVTQITSKATAVTLNKGTGEITTAADALAGNSAVAFTLNSTAIQSGDVVVPMIKSGSAASYLVTAEAAVTGACSIVLRNMTGAPLAEAVKISFVVIKGSIN